MNWWWGECPYSTKTREVLGNPSPPPSRFPSTLEISLGLRPREISWVSGNLLGVGDGFPNTSLVLVEHGYNTHLYTQRDSIWLTILLLYICYCLLSSVFGWLGDQHKFSSTSINFTSQALRDSSGGFAWDGNPYFCHCYRCCLWQLLLVRLLALTYLNY